MLETGIKAPGFELPDQNGKIHTLDEYRGRKVILYFYPKDNTAGCTKQACGFAELYPQFTEKGAVIIGVSKDSVASHKNLKRNSIFRLHFCQTQSFHVSKHMMSGRKKQTTAKRPWELSVPHIL